MLLSILKSKIHRAKITDASLHYEGSLTVDADLLEAAGMLEYEKVHVVNVNNGSRLETYLIKGAHGSGEVCLNGAAARLGHIGDLVIIIAYAHITAEEATQHKPTVVLVDEKNKIKARQKK